MILGFENTAANQRTNAGDGKGLDPDNIGRFAFPAVTGGAGARDRYARRPERLGGDQEERRRKRSTSSPT